ncbi:hypothetical protein MesoLj131a_62340 [Mesorhizobium sp. 131-2-1]|nr:hypothetical protein MesoLj131a_62340 [Mesorhizobium sp. 131-2-1]BCH04441.1 hypothetical protein MesoLj131b_64400 [Mesorhizobium sp. 131-2-5]
MSRDTLNVDLPADRPFVGDYKLKLGWFTNNRGIIRLAGESDGASADLAVLFIDAGGNDNCGIRLTLP